MAEDPDLEDLLSSVDTGTNQVRKDDVELSQLLDSALKDFGPSQTAGSEEGANVSAAAATAATSGPESSNNPDFPNLQELLKGECLHK